MSYFAEDRSARAGTERSDARLATNVEAHLARERRWRARLWWGFGGLVALALIAVLVYGHIAYWYLPRPRPAQPRADSRVASLLADRGFPAVLWLPYPHQNLGVLDLAAAEHKDFMGAFARLTELPPPVLPSFGGFSVVPSSELALAADETGERFVVMAQVYPALAVFSRLAGRIADNPWLAGGPVTVQGRAAEVTWEGNVWIVRSGGSEPPSEMTTPDVDDAAFGVLALHRPAGPFSPDLYRLGLDPDGALEVRGRTALPPALWGAAERLGNADMVLSLVAGPASDRGVQSLAFFSRDDDSSDLPRAATLVRADRQPSEPWKIPGASLARLAGGLEVDTVGDWRIEAVGRSGLDSARRLAPAIEAIAGAGHGSGDRLAWGLWADLGNTHAEIARLARLAARVPLVPRRDARRLRDAEIVLRPVAGRFEDLIIVVGDDPSGLRLVLSRRGAGRLTLATHPR